VVSILFSAPAKVVGWLETPLVRDTDSCVKEAPYMNRKCVNAFSQLQVAAKITVSMQ